MLSCTSTMHLPFVSIREKKAKVPMIVLLSRSYHPIRSAIKGSLLIYHKEHYQKGQQVARKRLHEQNKIQKLASKAEKVVGHKQESQFHHNVSINTKNLWLKLKRLKRSFCKTTLKV